MKLAQFTVTYGLNGQLVEPLRFDRFAWDVMYILASCFFVLCDTCSQNYA